MSNQFFLRIHDSRGLSWLGGRAGKDTQRGTPQALGAAADAAAGQRAVVLVPSTDVLFTRVSIPTRNRQRLAKAVPYALEDRLAGEVESMHFALGGRAANGDLAVAVVDRARMDAWLALLHDTGIEPHALVPDLLCLPWQPGEWTVLREHDLSLVRTGVQSGFVADTPNLVMLLELALAEASEAAPGRVRVIDAGAAGPELPEALGAGAVALVADASPGDPLALMAQHYAAADALNLLQGPYSRQEQLLKLWRPWRAAAALLAVWLLVQGIGTAVEYAGLRQRSATLDQQIEQLFRKTFPDVQRVVNAEAQMKQRLAALERSRGQSSLGFLELLLKTGRPLTAAGTELQSVQYRDGQLDVLIEIRDLQALDGLKQAIEQIGLRVEIQSATAREQGVSSRLRITEAVS